MSKHFDYFKKHPSSSDYKFLYWDDPGDSQDSVDKQSDNGLHEDDYQDYTDEEE